MANKSRIRFCRSFSRDQSCSASNLFHTPCPSIPSLPPNPLAVVVRCGGGGSYLQPPWASTWEQLPDWEAQKGSGEGIFVRWPSRRSGSHGGTPLVPLPGSSAKWEGSRGARHARSTPIASIAEAHGHTSHFAYASSHLSRYCDIDFLCSRLMQPSP